MVWITSDSEFGVLDVILAVSSLNDSIDNVGEIGEPVELVGGLGEGSLLRVQVGDLAEELSADTLSRVDVDAVFVVVGPGGGVLGEQGNLPNEVTLGTLCGGSLFGGLVVDLDQLNRCALNLDNLEGGSECVAGKG